MDNEKFKEWIERVKHGKHNQIVHGNRYGKAPSIDRARKLRKAGEFQNYLDRARQRSGTKPAKDREKKPKNTAEKKPITLPPTAKSDRITKNDVVLADNILGLVESKKLFAGVDDHVATLADMIGNKAEWLASKKGGTQATREMSILAAIQYRLRENRQYIRDGSLAREIIYKQREKWDYWGDKLLPLSDKQRQVIARELLKAMGRY